MDRRLEGEKLQAETCGKNNQCDTPRLPTPREIITNQLDAIQSRLMWNLHQLQELRDRLRFASDSELSLASELLQKQYLLNL